MTMTNVERFITEVRSYIGTPFVHAGRSKVTGVDCVGILVGAGKAVGIINYDDVNYSSRSINSEYLVAQLQRFSNQIPSDERVIGDILLFNVRGRPTHTGVLVTPTTFVHAYQTAGKVCETALEPHFIRSLNAVYRVREELWHN